MPAAGYALSAITLDRIPSFLSLLVGHMANYQSRGTFNAPEQLSLYGDGVPGRWTYADSYRGLLYAGRNEIDIDFCVPSTTLVPYMLKHLLVFEPRDANQVWLLKGAPRRFYKPNVAAIVVENAPTRYGNIAVHVNITRGSSDINNTDAGSSSSIQEGDGNGLEFKAKISWNLHGKGYVPADALRTAQSSADTDSVLMAAPLMIILRLRDHRGEQSKFGPLSATGPCTLTTHQNTPGLETVGVVLTNAKAGVAAMGDCIVVAALASDV
jgi:hypothetical protein